VVEEGSADTTVLGTLRHPVTLALLDSVPRQDGAADRAAR
jgi:hypothetical protein